jgi:bacteriorhodopsin
MSMQVAWLTIILWIVYPLIWLFSEGFASFSVSFEVCETQHIHEIT